MDNPLISIIIPVYNAEKYLHQCLDSVVAQTYTNWECLLIDDGSKDSSGAICDEYAAKDSRFRVFHKENGGVSSARNLGIKNANGSNIWFIDSDDYIVPNSLEFILPKLDNDLLFIGYVFFKDDRDIVYSTDLKNITSKTDEEFPIFLNYVMTSYKHLFGNMWSKIYRRCIIVDNGIWFNEKYSYKEDEHFSLMYLQYVKTMSVCTSNLYYYRQLPSSLSANIKDTNMFESVVRECYCLSYKLPMNSQLQETVDIRFARNLISICCRYFKEENCDNKQKRILSDLYNIKKRWSTFERLNHFIKINDIFSFWYYKFRFGIMKMKNILNSSKIK